MKIIMKEKPVYIKTIHRDWLSIAFVTAIFFLNMYMSLFMKNSFNIVNKNYIKFRTYLVRIESY